jgi:xylulokinase
MYLGIDVGTSAVKAVITSDAGRVCAQATAPIPVSRPFPLWSEQDPDEWWRATEGALAGLDAGLRAQVRGIGLAGQMHGATLLGSDDRPLRPAILWNDGRSHAECAELERREPRSRAITGNLAMPGFTAPKLLWVNRHEPEIFAAIESVLLPKDYVRLRMTGDKASDMADASGTLWLDVATRGWSDAMLAASGLTRAAMPGLFEGPQVTGVLRGEVAERWGMERVPVVAGGGDNAAGAAGVGVVAPGAALLSLGTSGVIFVATDRLRPNPERAVHAFCHCIPGVWHQMAVHLSAAACIDWAAAQLGLTGPAEVFALAGQAGPAAGPELFLPYLSGERTPFNDPHVRAAWLNLDNDTRPARLAAAVLEGVAFALADGLAALREAGSAIDELTVIGGGARSRHWGTIIAASCNARLVFIEGGEVGPSLGAARLAQAAVTRTDPTAICVRPPITHVLEPAATLAERLRPRLAAFRAASRAVRAI